MRNAANTDSSRWRETAVSSLRRVGEVPTIRRRGAASRRRVIYGEGHLWRHTAGDNLVSRLEAEGTMVFTISTPIEINGARLGAGTYSVWANHGGFSFSAV